jgi:hypothetical protein
MLFHNGKVQGIASRQAPISQNYCVCSLHGYVVNRQHLIDNPKKGIEGGLDCITTINGNVSMEYLLQHLGVCNQTLTVADQSLQ